MKDRWQVLIGAHEARIEQLFDKVRMLEGEMRAVKKWLRKVPEDWELRE
jgi:hypothetical protein